MSSTKALNISAGEVGKVNDEIGKLNQKIDDLHIKFEQSKLSSLITNTFSNASNVVRSFGDSINSLSGSLNDLKPVVEAIQAMQKTKDEAEKQEKEKVKQAAENAKKEAELEKKKCALLKTVTEENEQALKKLDKEQLEISVKQMERRKTEIEGLEKKFGTEIKYSDEMYAFYQKYYVFRKELYKDDAAEYKKASDEKIAFDKAYKASIIETNGLMEEQVKAQAAIVTKGEKDKSLMQTILKEIKNLSDVKPTSSIVDLTTLTQEIKEEDKLMAARKARIEELSKIVTVKDPDGYLNVPETGRNYKKLEELRKQDIEKLKQNKLEIVRVYNDLSELYTKDSEGWAAIQEDKLKKTQAIDNQIAADNEANKASNQAYFDSMAGNITKLHGEFDKYYSAVGGLAKDFLSVQLTDLNNDLEAVKKNVTEKEKVHKTHQTKVEALAKEASTASAGRAVVVQEQLAREIAARDAALQQQKEAEKEKEEIEKQIARKKKQQAKITKVQEIAKATADQSAAIIKAWGAGPVLGPIMAALTVISTGIQIAKMKQEWDKLEDGGLLRGKRHTQGGMRIEGTNIEVEGDEYVVNRDSTRKNLGLIEYINKSRRELVPADISTYYARSGQASAAVGNKGSVKRMFENGGQLTNLEVVSSAISQSVDDKVLDAISKINFRPVVSVVDIVNTQNSISEVREIAGA